MPNKKWGGEEDKINHKEIRFDVWDTAGQERYRCMLPMYYRSAAAAIIVLDVSMIASFKV